MRNRFKHKAAWWLRKIADYLEPRPITLETKQKYKPQLLSVIIDNEYEKGTYGYEGARLEARKQLRDAADRFIEVEENQLGPGGNNRTRLELKILVKND